MNPNLRKHISDDMKANIVWKKLENLFTKKSSGNKTTLIKRLVDLKYRDENNMVEHIISF